MVSGCTVEQVREKLGDMDRITVEEDPKGVRFLATGNSQHASRPAGAVNANHVLAQALLKAQVPVSYTHLAQNSIICTAPSKTFNIAGLKISNIVIPNDGLREKLLEKNRRDFASNALGIQACRICYDRCGAWKDEMPVSYTHIISSVGRADAS